MNKNTNSVYNIFTVLIVLVLLVSGCTQKKDRKTTNIEEIKRTKINPESKKAQNYVMKNPIIANRGSTYWIPEETERAYRWPRN